MILKQPKKPEKTGAYHRTKAQRQREDWGEKGGLERGYAKSEMDSGQITYPQGGDKI